ncbi:solute carrier organic anion transporter family member 1C1-like isoform X2 [Paramormyrops kingsleyae]|uniref:Solute carrier organic anion transporter family member n=3 Tax=Paramormyrops kingsleyae TaxID=1676925 RepID=A0A3B3R2K9_9TELE|nr:solute carrier organic anion transporter family member 1C1-like isoform X2 [Paramormyrops kingsleyae]XP_023681681.1 solute carrier organic anion transporter family member 1C1-like isoform X2 [Paramormyrops kingsleyae]XP_023681683.1 solute carrier organic anion transporter family member 1C1-like isoform X2 [Paramormyrops kingsleyae]XP_023681684.1 solute carrier organic anion transporter family member 1C1-like isoform X2 [Paramormyrops kingsleyae]
MDRGSGENHISPLQGHNHCCPNFKTFLTALGFAYFAKTLSGSYMKSTVTQLERRFDVPSYLIGVIDGSFEMGNLLVIAFVSYFGAKLHRPKIISVGCLLMSAGTFLMAIPHFITGRYKFETSVRSSVNTSTSLSPCSASSLDPLTPGDRLPAIPGCERESSLSMWIYVLLGNILRGIGETPIQPLGISYIDDYARAENVAFYIGCIQTISIIGPVFGYLLGSICAGIYVDIGFVDMDSITITPGDARWVGAWWLGFIIAGTVTLLSAIPFWFLPKSLPAPAGLRLSGYTAGEQSRFATGASHSEDKHTADEPPVLLEMAKEFLPSLKNLLGNPVYFLYLCVTIVQFNSLIGMVTYKPKYIEQHYGQSASNANFLMGVINIPAVALGMFSGGVIMKKFKMSLMGAAKFAFGTSLLGYLLSLFFFSMGCENARVAGITVTYRGVEGLSYNEKSQLADCNSGCFCSTNDWDPVCGENGITYVSPCLAGCRTSRGSGKNTVFEQCQCVAEAGQGPHNLTATAGHCPHREGCDRIFPYFLALSVISSFIISLGGTPGYILLIRCIKPELKSLALGLHTLATRTLAGIPAPIYFGAIIDSTCLKWGQNRCGRRGACRIYNTAAYRIVYLGLTLGLRTASFFLCLLGIVLLEKQIREEAEERGKLGNGTAEAVTKGEEEDDSGDSSAHYSQLIRTSGREPDRETRL